MLTFYVHISGNAIHGSAGHCTAHACGEDAAFVSRELPFVLC